MPLIFFNVGWMKHYNGQTDTDRIVNGGQYVHDNKTGEEINNFSPIGEYCYGYVQPPGNRINIQRLGAEHGQVYVDDVTIVFTATLPEGGRRVVGWFRNARVWRDEQRLNDRLYFSKARKEDCTLLAIDERVMTVPRARNHPPTWGFGQSNVRYVRQQDESQEFIRSIRGRVEGSESLRLPDVMGQRSHQPDSKRRATVERAAVDHVIAYYEARGFDCVSVEADNAGWDLEARQGAVELLIEIKGCSGPVGKVELTPNEYSAMTSRRYRESYRLAIVTEALDEKRRSLSIVSYNGADKTWQDQHGREANVKKRTGARIGLQ